MNGTRTSLCLPCQDNPVPAQRPINDDEGEKHEGGFPSCLTGEPIARRKEPFSDSCGGRSLNSATIPSRLRLTGSAATYASSERVPCASLCHQHEASATPVRIHHCCRTTGSCSSCPSHTEFSTQILLLSTAWLLSLSLASCPLPPASESSSVLLCPQVCLPFTPYKTGTHASPASHS